MSTSYGVYWIPIFKVASEARPLSYSFTNFDLKRMLEEMADGNPVIVWGTTANSYPLFLKNYIWKTYFCFSRGTHESGKKIFGPHFKSKSYYR